MQSVGGSQVITTNDPRLTALGLPQYPALPGSTDPSKIEEIRRTVYVSNLNKAVSNRKLYGQHALFVLNDWCFEKKGFN